MGCCSRAPAPCSGSLAVCVCRHMLLLMGLLSPQLLAETTLSREPSPRARAQAFGSKSSTGELTGAGEQKTKASTLRSRRWRWAAPATKAPTATGGGGRRDQPPADPRERTPARSGHDPADESGEGRLVPSEHRGRRRRSWMSRGQAPPRHNTQRQTPATLPGLQKGFKSDPCLTAR